MSQVDKHTEINFKEMLNKLIAEDYASLESEKNLLELSFLRLQLLGIIKALLLLV